MKKKKKNQLKNRQYKRNFTHNPDLSFREHVAELRARLIYVAASIIIGATIAYLIQQRLINILLKPSHGQQFIYTSPAGGISFLFNVCIYAGILISIPVIIYQILRFTEPLIKNSSKKKFVKFSALSGFLALAGIAFGYIVGLPVALNFLQHQFTTKQIRPLFTIQEYMSFVTFYLLGSALLFQTPLIISFFDRIRPIKPKRLFHYERYVIVVAFIISALMSPSVNIFSQLIIAIPIIIAYQVGILVVWLQHRSRSTHYSKKIKSLVQQDREQRERFYAAPNVLVSQEQSIEQVASLLAEDAVEPILSVDKTQKVPITDNSKKTKVRYSRLVDDFIPPKSTNGTVRLNVLDKPLGQA
jgi:sec-independent protein translocase protein TatC